MDRTSCGGSSAVIRHRGQAGDEFEDACGGCEEAGKLGGWEVGIVVLTDNRDERAELDRPLSTDLVGGVTCEERAD